MLDTRRRAEGKRMKAYSQSPRCPQQLTAQHSRPVVLHEVISSDSETLSIPSKLKPLVVDLDGTLVRSDLLVESAFAHLGHDPLRVASLLVAIRHGKAAFK